MKYYGISSGRVSYADIESSFGCADVRSGIYTGRVLSALCRPKKKILPDVHLFYVLLHSKTKQNQSSSLSLTLKDKE